MEKELKHFADGCVDTLSNGYSAVILGISLIFASDNMQVLFGLFIFFFLTDWITGVWASWIERDKDDKPKEYHIDSERARKTIAAKLFLYGIVFVFGWGATKIFWQNGITFWGVSAPLSPLEIATAICMTIEFWSNLENGKRIGFDVIGMVRGAAKTLWGAYNSVSKGKHD